MFYVLDNHPPDVSYGEWTGVSPGADARCATINQDGSWMPTRCDEQLRTILCQKGGNLNYIGTSTLLIPQDMTSIDIGKTS